MLSTIGSTLSLTAPNARASARAAPSSSAAEVLEADLGPRGFQEGTAAADAPAKFESSMPQVMREAPTTIQPGETGGVANEQVDRMAALRAFQAQGAVTRTASQNTQTTLSMVI